MRPVAKVATTNGSIYDLVNKRDRFKFEELRQRFRLTPTERRVAIFVIAAFVLGLATKCYRDAHPPTATPIEKRHSIGPKTQH
jgi:hypothetical protein